MTDVGQVARVTARDVQFATAMADGTRVADIIIKIMESEAIDSPSSRKLEPSQVQRLVEEAKALDRKYEDLLSDPEISAGYAVGILTYFRTCVPGFR